jgi:hypothetical protein
MMREPPAEPSAAATLSSRSSTKVGDIDERGRLPGWTRLATGLPFASGSAEKSVSSLFSSTPRTMICAPNGASMVVVKLTALPQRSTMLMWLVPRST